LLNSVTGDGTKTWSQAIRQLIPNVSALSERNYVKLIDSSTSYTQIIDYVGFAAGYHVFSGIIYNGTTDLISNVMVSNNDASEVVIFVNTGGYNTKQDNKNSILKNSITIELWTH
jgi:O-glycosyl hydrolase